MFPRVDTTVLTGEMSVLPAHVLTAFLFKI